VLNTPISNLNLWAVERVADVSVIITMVNEEIALGEQLVFSVSIEKGTVGSRGSAFPGSV
jgi:hypothetical protein